MDCVLVEREFRVIPLSSISSFETRVPGKWILAGEHAVLRGCPALVFPLQSRVLELSYVPHQTEGLKLELDGDHGGEMQLLFWGVLEKASELTKIHRGDLRGTLKIRSSIPVGAGLGASAALCVAMARWFHSMKLIREIEMYEFARTLENLFHGESSGVDIAVALSGEGIRFTRATDVTASNRQVVDLQWKPTWYVSYSGKRGVTSECVARVKSLIAKDPELGFQIDLQMKQAVNLAEEALKSSAEIGFSKLAESIQLANNCFEKWGLSPEAHSKWLLEQGAVAVKPTGSGDGGYVLSLWKTPPAPETLKSLIPCL